jgi:hypothetical protein
MGNSRGDAKDILDKYSRKLQSQLSTDKASIKQGGYSREYKKFKGEMTPELTRYEKWAQSIGNTIKINVSEKDRRKIQKNLDDAHVDVTASQAITLSLISMLGVFFLTIAVAVAIFLIKFPSFDELSFQQTSDLMLFVFLGMVASMFIFYYTYTMPKRLGNSWKLRASAQMVPAVLYVVVYMKHTSNLERAIAFAAEHLEGPLGMDFKKIFYDVEIGKYSTIKQSLDNYLDSWKDYAPEFVEAFHLIESSLFEPSEGRRVEILEKSLQIELDGVYEKMLKYSREIRTPLTNLYMLGIILPTLGLALLPLASTLLKGVIRWPHVMVLFNIIIPFFVFYMVSEVLLKRPGGYGESSTLELNPDYHSFKSKKPWLIGALVALPFLILGFLPFIFQIGFLVDGLELQSDYSIEFGGSVINYFDFKETDSGRVGPFGPIAMLCSLFIPLSLVLFLSFAYSRKTKKLIKTRENTKELEKEFANSLFQFGNRLGDGMPAEMVFGKVALSTKGQKSSEFFSLVSQNIQSSGMSLENAIFDRKRGAIIYYPSALIGTSMKILIESVKKGLKIAARSLMSISEYVKNIGKINQRLRDLLAEIVSDMKSNMVFLAPLLAGIVVGLSSMITFILNKLEELQTGEGGVDVLGIGIDNITGLFDVTQMIPPYFIQISIGLYIIQVIFILTSALVTVDAGKDPLREKYELAKNLRRGMMLYLITALVSIVSLSLLAGIALGGFGG